MVATRGPSAHRATRLDEQSVEGTNELEAGIAAPDQPTEHPERVMVVAAGRRESQLKFEPCCCVIRIGDGEHWSTPRIMSEGSGSVAAGRLEDKIGAGVIRPRGGPLAWDAVATVQGPSPTGPGSACSSFPLAPSGDSTALDLGARQGADDLLGGRLGHIEQREAVRDLDRTDRPPRNARLSGDRTDAVDGSHAGDNTDGFRVRRLPMTVPRDWTVGGPRGESDSLDTGLDFMVEGHPWDGCPDTIEPKLGPSFDDLVSYLEALPRIEISEMRFGTLDGYRAVYLEYRPADGPFRLFSGSPIPSNPAITRLESSTSMAFAW